MGGFLFTTMKYNVKNYRGRLHTISYLVHDEKHEFLPFAQIIVDLFRRNQIPIKVRANVDDPVPGR